MKFPDLLEIEKYLEVSYEIANRLYPIYFQFQFVNITINDADLTSIQVFFERERKRSAKQKERLPRSSIGKENNRKQQAKHRSNIFGTPKHERMKEKTKKRVSELRANITKESKKQKKYFQNNGTDSKVASFKKKTHEGPYFICIVCNRCLYRRSVILFIETKYPLFDQSPFEFIESFDCQFYICKTCDKRIKKGDTPCQAVPNKLEVYDFPEDLKNIRRLERVLIARRLLFKKIHIMPKGQSPKIKGAICNVPVDTVDISGTLPRQADSNGLIIVKLKRKLEYRGHVYFESVRPNIINRLLQYLKLNNQLYADIEIDISHVPSNFVEMLDFDDEIPMEIDRSEYDHGLGSTADTIFSINPNLETEENPLTLFWVGYFDLVFGWGGGKITPPG